MTTELETYSAKEGFPLSITTLKAVSHAMSSEETRYYLNGVCVDAQEDNTYLVATDGRFIIRVKLDIILEDLEGKFILQKEFVKQVISWKKSKRDADKVTLCINEENQRSTAHYYDMDFTMKLIDGSFPDYMRILTELKENKLTYLCFNGNIMERINKAVRLMTGTRDAIVTLHCPKDNGSAFHVTCAKKSFEAMIIPCRSQ